MGGDRFRPSQQPEGAKTVAYQVEVTDTFGGDANYSWVRRYTIETPTCEYRDPAYSRTLVRRAKAAAGWTGLRCATYSHGDQIEVRPTGRRAPCWVMFITWNDGDEAEG